MPQLSNLILLLLFCIPIQLDSQQTSKASNNWYFGNKAGITFNTIAPSALTDGLLNTQEGVATVSNFQGELLFYTDGSTIWDRTHQPMPLGNGTLKGHFSSTQSASIVPRPGHINSYYVFTVDELGGSNGLHYSIVDISLSGNGSNGSPLGDIIPNTLNTPLISPVCEKITSIQKENDNGYWVIVHGWRDNVFYTYDITCEGINPNPIETSIGEVHQGGSGNINAVGYLKSNLNGDKIALVSRTSSSVDIFDFNKSTGIISNELQIFPNSNSLYGIEFSPLGEYLYIGGRDNIERYSFLENSINIIPYDFNSILGNDNVVRALQLGPDLNLYISHRYYDYLSVIMDPDNESVFIRTQGIFLDPDNIGRECRFGLPNNIVIPQPKYDSIDIWTCEGEPVQFENFTFEAGASSLVNLQTSTGCDSFILLTIFEHQGFNSMLNFQACENTSIEFNGVEILAGDQEEFIFQDMNGCDSIITVFVDIEISFEEDVFLQTCHEQSITYNNEVYPPGTDTTITTQSIDNCDSVIHLIVFEYPELTATLTFEACENTFIEYNGIEIFAGNQEEFIFQGLNGCDSTVTVIVEFAMDIEEDVLLETCYGQSVIYNNEFYLPGTDTIINIQSIDNCDSVIHLTVFEYPELTSTVNLETCEDTFVEYNGVEILAGEQEEITFQSMNGCDSTVTVNVDITSIIEEELFLVTCFGQSIIFRNEIYPPGTDIIINVESIDNCDTAIHLTVFEYPENSSNLVLEACENAIIEFNNVELSVGDQELFTFLDMNGCDSIVTVTVESTAIIEESVYLESCFGMSVLYNNEEFLVGTDTTFEAFDVEGCKKLISLEVGFVPEPNFTIITNNSCANLNNGNVNLSEIEGGRPPFQFSLDGQNYIDDPIFLDLESKDYTYYIRDANNCIINTDFRIEEIPELLAEIDSREMTCEEDSILVSVFTNIPESEIDWSWSNGSTISSTYIFEPGEYSVQFKNECQSFNEDISISRQRLDIESLIYIPNAFSPNKDGINDDFQVLKNKKFDIYFYELQIFDRWGNNVFISNDIDFTWNGDFKNLELQNEIYVWWLKIEGEVCKEKISIFEKGNFTILK